MQRHLHAVELSMYLFVLFITGIDGGMLNGLLGMTGFSLFLAGLALLMCLLLHLYRRSQPHAQVASAWQKARRHP
jgi:uncharacterized membrane protein YfcA